MQSNQVGMISTRQNLGVPVDHMTLKEAGTEQKLYAMNWQESCKTGGKYSTLFKSNVKWKVCPNLGFTLLNTNKITNKLLEKATEEEVWTNNVAQITDLCEDNMKF